MMPTTLTLRHIPDDVYLRLEASAAAHRRSLSSEAIACLAAALMPERMSTRVRLARARALRAALPKSTFRADDIDTYKRERQR